MDEAPNDTNDDEIAPVKANHSADGVNETDMVDDPLRTYLSQIGRVSLLTAKDERAIARALESGAYVERLEREFILPGVSRAKPMTLYSGCLPNAQSWDSWR